MRMPTMQMSTHECGMVRHTTRSDSRRPMSRAISIILTTVTLLCACDSDKGPTPEQKAAQAAEAEKQKQEEEALAKRKAEREAKQKAEKEAKAKFDAALEAVALIPEGTKVTGDLVKACDEVAAAQDAFMQRLQKGDALEQWNAKKDETTPMTKIKCTQGNSPKIAACVKHGLDNAPEELKDAFDDIFNRCVDKYRSAAGGAGTIRKKPL